MMDVEQIADAVFRGVEARIGKALEPLLERLEALESIEIPAVPTAADVARTLLAGDEIKTLVDLHVTEAVEQIETIKGDPGEPGKDGVGLAGALIDRDGNLVVTLANGEAKNLGPVVGKDGQNGIDGKDGAGLTELVRTYDAEKHEIVERWGEKELRYPAGGIRPGDYWREGTKAVAASVWTHAGVAWIAKRDTSDKPSRDSADWQIFANKGRDGTDGRAGRDLGPPEPVKLRNGDA
jgi:hypothetical protein